MTTTYLWLNLGVLTALAGLMAARPSGWNRRSLIPILLAMLVLTAMFDSLIVGLGIVAYDPTKIWGITVGRAPIEDFAYCVLAAVLVPYVWERFK